MTPELSRRIGSIVGRHTVTPAERMRIISAAKDAETWEDLPNQVVALLDEIAEREGPDGEHTTTARGKGAATDRSMSTKSSRPQLAEAIQELRVLRDRLSGQLRQELESILASLAKLSAKRYDPNQLRGDDGRWARTGVLGSVLDDLASLREKLSDDDRSALDRAMAKLRNLESSDVDDDDLADDESDDEDSDDGGLVMESASGEVQFTPYSDGDVDVDWEDSPGFRLSPQSAREVHDAVTKLAALPVAEGPPPLPDRQDWPDWVTDQDTYRRWLRERHEQWAATDAGRRHDGVAGQVTTSDGELKVARLGSGVMFIGDPDSVDAELADGAMSGVLQLDDPGEARQFADLLRDATVIAGSGPQAGKSSLKGASTMATKSFTPTVKAVGQSGEGTATIKIASFGEVDKDGDVTVPGFFGEQYVQFVPTHNWDSVWLGKGRVYEKPDGAYCDVKFNLEIEDARDWYSAIKFDYENPPSLAEYSYGYNVLPGGSKSGQHQGRQVRFLQPRDDGSPGVEVFEVGSVMKGAGNDTGTVSVKGRGMRINRTGSTASRAVKGAIPCHETKTVSRAWDRVRTEAALPEDARPSELRTVYAYVDPDGDPELKGSYSWPHHHGIGGPANLRACLMGIAALNGPAGADMGEPERKGIYDHLAGHLKDADRDVPDLRTGPGDSKNRRFSDEAATVLAAVGGLTDRASEVMAMRRTKGKGMAANTADLLGWVSDELVRLKGLLSNPVEPEIAQPDDDEVASVFAASIARLNGI